MSKRQRQYFVYIMASYRGTLYTGVTNNVERRALEHRNKLVDCFTKKYNISKLVYVEATDDIGAAIQREKEIKGWRRSKKAALIESMNPYWIDLADASADAPPPQTLRPPGSGLRVTT